jgi:type II secretory pathway predicted ATPase ExeA
MNFTAAGLQVQPFHTHGKPLVFVPYASQKAAVRFLIDTHTNDRGLGLFQGPPLSGKTTIVQHFARSLPRDCAVAVVDGAGMSTTALLQSALSQFGYNLGLNSESELFNMIKVFTMQQAATGHAPLLIIENTHKLNPGALHALCELAELKVHAKAALHLVLCSDHSILPIVRAPAMMPVSERITGEYRLGTLTQVETRNYLHTKLRSGGCSQPEGVLPGDVCDALHSASGGWPGMVDRLVLDALGKARRCPLRTSHLGRQAAARKDVKRRTATGPQPVKSKADTKGNSSPRIILTYNGKTLSQVPLKKQRMLIGRSAHNDLRIDAELISRNHALLIRHGNTTFIMDLNSKNGTFVNSRRISNLVLIDQDIISIGNYRIKFIDPKAKVRGALQGSGFNDTVLARSLEDVRNVLARTKKPALKILGMYRK